MSLQPLEWRKLPDRIFPANITATSSYFLDTIYDMLTGSFYSDGSARVIGSGSAWQMPTKFVTGSNTEAVYVFPGFQTEISQSVIFACKSKTGAVSSATVPVVTGSRTSTLSYGRFVLSTGSLYGAVVKNAIGSFTQWTSQTPFGGSSYSSGYASVTVLPSALDKMIICESKEAIAVITQTSVASVQIFIAGAIIDPEQTTTSIDAESDNRLYGLISAADLKTAQYESYQVAGFDNTFLTSSNLWTPLTQVYDYNDPSNVGGNEACWKTPKFVIFNPQTSSFITPSAEKFLTNTFAIPNPIDVNIESPIRCCTSNFSADSSRLWAFRGNSNFLGTLRDIVAIKNRSNGETIRDPNNKIIGYTISSVGSAQNHTLCLKY